MNFRPKKKVQVEFIVPDSVDVRAGDLEEFLRQYTKKAKVESHVENIYLSEVSLKVPKKSLVDLRPHVIL